MMLLRTLSLLGLVAGLAAQVVTLNGVKTYVITDPEDGWSNIQVGFAPPFGSDQKARPSSDNVYRWWRGDRLTRNVTLEREPIDGMPVVISAAVTKERRASGDRLSQTLQSWYGLAHEKGVPLRDWLHDRAGYSYPFKEDEMIGDTLHMELSDLVRYWRWDMQHWNAGRIQANAPDSHLNRVRPNDLILSHIIEQATRPDGDPLYQIPLDDAGRAAVLEEITKVERRLRDLIEAGGSWAFFTSELGDGMAKPLPPFGSKVAARDILFRVAQTKANLTTGAQLDPKNERLYPPIITRQLELIAEHYAGEVIAYGEAKDAIPLEYDQWFQAQQADEKSDWNHQYYWRASQKGLKPPQ